MDSFFNARDLLYGGFFALIALLALKRKSLQDPRSRIILAICVSSLLLAGGAVYIIS